MDWIPNDDRVLIKPINAEQKIGGLYIPDISTNLKKGEVVAVGKGRKCSCCGEKHGVPLISQVGQIVQFKPEDGIKITLEDEQYMIFKEEFLVLFNSL